MKKISDKLRKNDKEKVNTKEKKDKKKKQENLMNNLGSLKSRRDSESDTR